MGFPLIFFFFFFFFFFKKITVCVCALCGLEMIEKRKKNREVAGAATYSALLLILSVNYSSQQLCEFLKNSCSPADNQNRKFSLKSCCLSLKIIIFQGSRYVSSIWNEICKLTKFPNSNGGE